MTFSRLPELNHSAEVLRKEYLEPLAQEVFPAAPLPSPTIQITALSNATVVVEVRNKYEVQMPPELSSKLSDALDYVTSSVLSAPDDTVDDDDVLCVLADHLAHVSLEVGALRERIQGALARMEAMDRAIGPAHG